jgi:hypothetical protein
VYSEHTNRLLSSRRAQKCNKIRVSKGYCGSTSFLTLSDFLGDIYIDCDRLAFGLCKYIGLGCVCALLVCCFVRIFVNLFVVVGVSNHRKPQFVTLFTSKRKQIINLIVIDVCLPFWIRVLFRIVAVLHCAYEPCKPLNCFVIEYTTDLLL